jgi:hypothetical protein
MHFDGTGKMKHEKVDPDRDHLTTIPHWTGEFSYHGITYPYTMVGTDPKKGSATTVVPTVIIPLRFVFADGSVVDSSRDLIDGQTAIHGIVNSPIFKPYPFISGGTHVGNTQWGDAGQRANFWNYVSTRSPDYHVLLGQPTVLPVQTINVPADKGGYDLITFFGFSEIEPFVDADFLNQQRRAITSQLGINPRSLPIFVTGTVAPTIGNYHGAENISSGKNSGAVQTYLVIVYDSQSYLGGYFPDISSLSHELSEWLSDPFTNNFTPGWNFPTDSSEQCESGYERDLLEVCDQLDALITSSNHGLPSSSFTYHVEDRVFLDFFTRAARSNSVNGQFSFFGGVTSPSSPCTGHLEVDDFTALAVPGATVTAAHSINNRGQIVGDYQDSAGVRHGFFLKGGQYTTIDPPGTTFTFAQQIDDAGVIVGFYDTPDGLEHGFSYQNGHYATLNFPGAPYTDADGISGLGQIDGAYVDNSGITHGFILDHGHYLSVDAPGAANTVLNSANYFGLMTGFTFADSSSPSLGFLRLGNHYTNAQFPGSLDTQPNGLNNFGTYVGYFDNASGYSDGFINLFGYPYEIYGFPVGINDLGQMVGYYYDNNGNVVGFTAQVPTKPAGH